MKQSDSMSGLLAAELRGSMQGFEFGLGCGLPDDPPSLLDGVVAQGEHDDLWGYLWASELGAACG